jgi:hypothetical protein
VAEGLVDGAAAAGGGSSRHSRAGSATAADEAQLATLDMQVRDWRKPAGDCGQGGWCRPGGWGLVKVVCL